MFAIKNFQPRIYQSSICKTIESSNTLVVLPTGLGKTKIAILAAINRLNAIPGSKALILTPTKPLTNQIFEEFKECADVKFITQLTGATPPIKRATLFSQADIIIATPQTIQSDLQKNRISLEDVSLLCVDEAHRSRMKFANTVVAQAYVSQAKNQRILALTASPGGTRQKIREICENLCIEKTEIRADDHEEVIPYTQKKEVTWVNVNLPEEYKETLDLIEAVYNSTLGKLRSCGLTKPIKLINKRDLLKFHAIAQSEIRHGNKPAFYKISTVAQAIKLMHAIELLETQGAQSLKRYWEKLSKETTKASAIIRNNKNIVKAIELTSKIKATHPKMLKLTELIQEQLKNNPDSSIMVFASFRFTVDEIVKNLNTVEGIRAIKLVGQKEGLSQKEQVQIIRDYEDKKYNCIVATSIGEEGLSLEAADLAIFYEPVASEIRTIQRTGRVGRTKEGKVIALITKGTRDEAYYWVAKRKENIMKSTLFKMQEDQAKL